MLEKLAGGFLWPKVRPRKLNVNSLSATGVGADARIGVGVGIASGFILSLIGALGGIGGVNILGIFNDSAYAAKLEPSATLTINNGGTTNFSTTLDTNNGTKSALIAVPVKVEVEQTDKYSMGIYLDCTDAPSECNTSNLGALTDSNLASVGSGSDSSATTRIESTTTNIQFGNIATNHWGFWYLNNTTTPTVEGSTGTYVLPVPTTTTGTNTIPETAISNAIPETSAGSTGTTTVNGQLVFGTKADSTLASGSYSGKVVVTLTATPQEVADTITSFADLRNMQDMNPALCADAEIGDVTNLKDTRDGKYYVVGKLADGRCWMLQNLALEGETTIYPSDSNIAESSYTLPPTGSAGNSIGSARWNDDQNTIGWMFDGHHINTGLLEASYIASVKDEAATTNVDPATSTPKASTGAYYSYMVATAGTGTSNTKYDKAPASICPKGWHLPTGGDVQIDGNGEFQTLYDAYDGGSRGQAAGFNNDFRYAATGFCDLNGCPTTDGNTYYWSSTIYGPNNGNRLGFVLRSNGSSVLRAYANNKRHGYSVRCVADNTMQSMTAEACGALEDGDTLNLMDARDAKYYVVGKLADGNCWMLQNLALRGDTVITADDSNITPAQYNVSSPKAGYKLPTSSDVTSGRWNSDTDATGYMFNGTHINNGTLVTSEIASIIDVAPPSNNNTSTSTGAYYSYAVATAGAGVNTGQNPHYQVKSSICPKNWHLPTSGDRTTGSKVELEKLYEAYDKNYSTFYTAFKWAPTGLCNSTYCPSVSGNDASYWSSTLGGIVTYGFYLYVSNGLVGPAYANPMRLGLSVRCMLTAAQ